MARTSKKKQEGINVLTDQRPGRTYSVGIYARLSVDAKNMSCEQVRKNESIETQVEIAKKFIGQQKNMEIYDCYIDIGKTGTNFEREGFERMMYDVRARRIDCIVVKDLSRFGRNHIETGNYIEKIFPFMGVRFIAVTDNFDSMNLSGQSETLCVNLKNLVNEMYARDIAVKVKSGKKAKWEQGSYTGGIPPYGYRAEWIAGKKSLFIEDATSDIVKKIYELFLSGKNMKEIALWLYENRVVRPTEYHRTGQIYSQKPDQLEEWSRGTIKSILTNPVYLGCLIQGRTCGKDYIMHKLHDIDPEDWSIKEHAHEAVISEEQFFEAAAKFEKSSIYCNKSGFSSKVPLDEDIFAGVLYCGDCGAKMNRVSAIKEFHSKDKVRTYSYNCPNVYRIDEFKCIGKYISLSSLTRIVKEAIRQEFSLSSMRPKELIESNNREAEVQKKKWDSQVITLAKRLEGITKLGSEQYLKYRMGEMDKECFRQAKEENESKAVSLKREISSITEKLSTIDALTIRKNHFLNALVKGSEKGGLTMEVVQTLISRIEIYPDRRVKMIFTFKRCDIFSGRRGG